MMKVEFKLLFLSLLSLLFMFSLSSSEGQKGAPGKETREEIQQKFDEARGLYRERKAQGFDLRGLDELIEGVREAIKQKNYLKADGLLDRILEGLRNMESVAQESVDPKAKGEPQKEIGSVEKVQVVPTVSHFGVSNMNPKFAKVMADGGVKWARIHQIQWGEIEPRPPAGGRHTYKWDRLDEAVKGLQAEGFQIQGIIKSVSPWAVRTGETGRKRKGMASGPPSRPEDWEAYGKFIFSLVERYDGDGMDDMPGLKYPVRYWQIESEAHNLPLWSGTAEEYLKLLQAAYRSAKKADPQTKILMSEFNLGDLFDRVEGRSMFEERLELQEKYPPLKKALRFINLILDHPESFDVVSFHANYDYTGITPTVNWLKEGMKRRGYEMPIWIGDAASAPLLGTKRLLSERADPQEDKALLEALDDEDSPKYREKVVAFRQAQAVLSFKKCVIAMASGVERIFLVAPFDWPNYHIAGYRHTGLLDRGGRPRPVYHTYRLLIEKLDGLTSIEALDIGDSIYAYRVNHKEKPLYIVWIEGQKEMTIPLEIRERTGEVSVTDVVPESDGRFIKTRHKIMDGKVNLKISDVPVIIEVTS